MIVVADAAQFTRAIRVAKRRIMHHTRCPPIFRVLHSSVHKRIKVSFSL